MSVQTLFVWRTVRKPPLGPGTAPRTRSRLLVGSTRTTLRFRTVIRALPYWPGLRIPLRVWAGSALGPDEPGWRCIRLTPWVARSPLKPCRLMTPEKPRPLLVPMTSTRLISLKTSTVRVCPSATSVGGLLADLADVALGLGVDLLGVAALGLGGALPLLVGEAELHGVVAVALLGPDLEHGARAALQDGDRDGGPVGLVDLGHADFAAEQSDAHRRNSVVNFRPFPAVRPARTTPGSGDNRRERVVGDAPRGRATPSPSRAPEPVARRPGAPSRL